MNSSVNALSLQAIWQPLTQQRAFRALMRAFAYPGRPAALADSGTTALTAVLATLLDGEASLADPHEKMDAADWPRLEARRAAPEAADFIVLDGRRAPDFAPRLGTLESPEKGATLIVQVAALGAGDGVDKALSLTGPGIADTAQLAVTGLNPAWLAARRDWCAAFPLGVDFILVDAQQAVCLPRTTRIQEREQSWAM